MEKKFDLITVDGELPDGYGLDLIQEAKKDNATVIMISGSPQFASLAIEMGADAFISKDAKIVQHLIQCFVACHFHLRK